MNWNLDDLYKGLDSEEYQSDFRKFKESIAEQNKWTMANLTSYDTPKETLEEALRRQSEIRLLATKVIVYPMLLNSVNAKDAESLKYQGMATAASSELTISGVMLEKWINGLSNLDEIIESSDFLKEHRFVIEESKKRAAHLLSDAEEIIMAKMTNTGSTAFTTLQSTIVSSHMVELNLKGENKKLPLPAVRNLAYVKDAETRKVAYEAELASYPAIEHVSAAALNAIKGEAITKAKARGYEDLLAETLVSNRLDKESLDAMISAMEDSLPSFRRYWNTKAKMLGHSSGHLPFYDLFAPLGKLDKEFSLDDTKEFIIKNFGKFSTHMAEYAQKAFDQNWIDAFPKEGKRGGAFCMNIYPLKQSRFLTNFDGSFSNVTTVAHELGHGFHGECIFESETVLNSSYPMPLAETASIFAETIVKNAMLDELTDEEAFTVLEASISDAGQVVVDILSRFYFESEVVKRREESTLSPGELNNLMLDAQRKTYGDGLDANYLHPYMWVNKTHYYAASRNFYNFPYAFGLLFTTGLYAIYKEEPTGFDQRYEKLLKSTGKMSIKDVAATMGIDITKKDFWQNSLRIIEGEINKFIDLSSNIK